MKSFLTVSSFFFALSGFAQQTRTSKLVLSINDCRGGDPYAWMFCDSISFFKLPEDTFAFKILPRKYKKASFILDSVPVSAYKVRYKNNFRQQVIKLLEVVAGERSVIDICVDSLLDYPQNTLLKLQPDDTISIGFSSFGCFDIENERIVIRRKKDEFIATIFYLAEIGVVKNIRQNQKVNSKPVVLTDKNVKDFIRFENELNFVNDGACTSVDEYVIKGKYLVLHKVDGHCKWDGFAHLKKSFFDWQH